MRDKSKNERILAEARMRRDGHRILEVEEEKVKLVVFSLLDKWYAFPGKYIKEILRVDKITCVPGSPEAILGIINVRGDIESVVDLNKLLGLPYSEPTARSRIVVASFEEIRSGILVDGVDDVVDIPVSSIQPPLSTLDKYVKDFVTGEMTFNHRNVTILSVGKVLGKISG